MTSRADRERHVAQMLASSRLEGFEPDEAHQQLLQDYIEGIASLDDLLNHARDYAAAAVAYRSRPADDGGTYYLLPRDRHLLPERDPVSEPIRLTYQIEQVANRPKENIDPEVAALVDAFLAQLPREED